MYLNRPMSSKALWAQFDRVFEEMDKFFEQFDRFAKEAKSVNANVHFDSPDEQKVRFRSATLKERAKYAWSFFCMTVSMVFRGHATVTFRRRKPIK
jgi:hypothetical protein